MNMETGEIISGSDIRFQEMHNRGVLMPLDEAEKTTCKQLKAKLARTQFAIMNRLPLSKNEAKRRRKSMKNKKVTS